MALFDLVLLIIIGGFALFGLWFGFIHTLGSLLGTVIGIYLASRYYEPVAGWLVEATGWGENVSNVVMFTLAFIIINRVVGMAFWSVDRVLNLALKLPFLKSLNRLLGGALGLLEGLVTIGFVIYVSARFPFSDWVQAGIESSFVSPIALDVVGILLPLLPEGLRVIQEATMAVEQAI